jgi:FAD synthetase
LPYCSLYDLGYTSLGEVHNTIKNPFLKYELDGIELYKPAYMLEDEDKERESRASAVGHIPSTTT